MLAVSDTPLSVHSTRALRATERRVEQWRERGAAVEWIEAPRVPEVLGTRYYKGAWKDLRGGSVNPLGFARGLTRAAAALGATIHTATPVESLEHAGGAWRLKTPRGNVAAERVVIATNAYSDDVLMALGSTIVPVRSAQVASAPLTPEQASAILPGSECASDTRRLLTSFRITPGRYLIMGGAGATGGDYEPPMVLALHRAAAEIFPQLRAIPWRHAWSGVWAVTADHLPHLHEPAPGVFAALGCNGRGIALATLGPRARGAYQRRARKSFRFRSRRRSRCVSDVCIDGVFRWS